MNDLYQITITFTDKENKHEEIADAIGDLLENYGIEDDVIIGSSYMGGNYD